jgi:hypothetical protein
MAEAMKILHTDKDFTYKVLGKQLRVTDMKLLDASYNAEIKTLEPRLDIRLEALQAMLDEISQTETRAKKVKPQDLVDRRYLDEMGKSGFFDQPTLEEIKAMEAKDHSSTGSHSSKYGAGPRYVSASPYN